MTSFETFNAWSSWTTLIFDFGFKSFVIMAVTLLVLHVLRRASASVRHIVCATGLLSLLALPFLSLLLPPLLLPISWYDASSTITRPMVERDLGVERESFRPEMQPVRPSVERGEFQRARRTQMPMSWVWVLWGLGIATMLAALSVNIVRRKNMSRTAKWVPLEPWATQAHELSRELNLNRPVMLLESADVAVPVTWGWIKPVILLPLHAQDWPQARRELVLRHELTHIKRRDQLVQFLGQLVCALYWFNPLVWVVLLKLQQEQENACDNEVLLAGTKPSDYAEHLLEVVRSLRTTNRLTLATVPMARSSKLAVRIRAILSENVRRMPINRRIFAIAMVLIAFAILPLAAARPDSDAPASRSLNLQTLFQKPIDGIKIALSVFSLADDSDVKVEKESVEFYTTSNWMRAKPGGFLAIELRHPGSVEISGWDENRISVVSQSADSEQPLILLRNSDGGFSLKSIYTQERSVRNARTDFVVRIPHHFNLFLSRVNGNIAVHKIEGSVTGGSITGDVHFQHMKGELDFSISEGAITLEDCRVNGEARTFNTDPVLLTRVQGNLRAYNIEGKCINEDVTYISDDGGHVRTNGTTLYGNVARRYKAQREREDWNSAQHRFAESYQKAIQKANEQRNVQNQNYKKMLERQRERLEKLKSSLDQMDLGDMRQQIQERLWEENKDLRKLKQELERELGLKLPAIENFQTREDYRWESPR